MTATAMTGGQNAVLSKRVIAGIVGGLAGGIVFGMMMATMGMLATIAGMVGSGSPVVGFLIHMMISAFIGAVFGVVVGNRADTLGKGALLGVVNGMVWWILGPIIIMPTMLGMDLQFGSMFSGPNLLSLMGHMVYGVIAGLGYVWYLNRK